MISQRSISRDDVLELARTSDLEGMAAEMFVRLDITAHDLLETSDSFNDRGRRLHLNGESADGRREVHRR